MLKYPAGRISSARAGSFKLWIFSGERQPADFRLAMAFSTLVQFVFWVSIAPVIISNGVSPGHQFCGPKCFKSS